MKRLKELTKDHTGVEVKDRSRDRTYKGYEEWMSWLLRDGTSGKN